MENIPQEFTREADRRGIKFSIDSSSGRYRLEFEYGTALVSLDNLEKSIAADGDLTQVSRFIDAVMASQGPKSYTSDGLLWLLEPGNYVEKPEMRVRISGEVDRVLVHLSCDRRSVTWVSPDILTAINLDADRAGEIAFGNLDRELASAKLEFQEIDGVRLGFLSVKEPVKASLLLAPGLRQKVEQVIGWPVLAVAPDRNFLLIWAKRHEGFVGRVGRVVVEEYSKSAYPLSTEVFALDDHGIRAIGAFPIGD